MAYAAYFDNGKLVWKIASGETEINLMDSIYVVHNNAVKKNITQDEFNSLNNESKTAVIDADNNIVWSDISHPQYTSETTEVDDEGVNLFVRLKEINVKRQQEALKQIRAYLDTHPTDSDWTAYKNILENLNFEDNSIYPLINGYTGYVQAQSGIPQFSLLRLS
tara:strand:- start:3929 stop:4420 length:492 start_codon:yes stop_codon:yes gene_type:complete